MKDLPNWFLPVVVGVAGLAIYNRMKGVGAAAGKAAQAAGEKASASLFDFLHPQFRPENYNKPTVVNAQMVGGKYVCPQGYRHKLTAKGEHLCFRED
jgi:hypothetical protein